MIPFILAGLGGYLIGDSLNEQEFAKGGLAGFDVSSLDALEKIQYKDLTEKSNLSKEDALSIIINNVEGDYEQLSSKLSKIAKQLAKLPKGQMTLFADGGMSKDTDVKHFKILKDFKRLCIAWRVQNGVGIRNPRQCEIPTMKDVFPKTKG